MGRYVTHLSGSTNPNAARDGAVHTIVVPPENHTIVVPPEDCTIVVPPPTPDDCVVALPDGRRFWVSLPPDVQAFLPHGLRVEGAAVPDGLRTRRPSVARTIAAAKKAGASSVTTPDGCIIRFGEPEPTEAANPWLTDLPKVRQ